MAGPFKLPTKENQDAEKLKRDSINKVKHWAELYIPAEVLQTRDCIVDVSESQCGDPNCAPIDTVVRLLFKGNVGYAFSRFRFVIFGMIVFGAILICFNAFWERVEYV